MLKFRYKLTACLWRDLKKKLEDDFIFPSRFFFPGSFFSFPIFIFIFIFFFSWLIALLSLFAIMQIVILHSKKKWFIRKSFFDVKGVYFNPLLSNSYRNGRTFNNLTSKGKTVFHMLFYPIRIYFSYQRIVHPVISLKLVGNSHPWKSHFRITVFPRENREKNLFIFLRRTKGMFK